MNYNNTSDDNTDDNINNDVDNHPHLIDRDVKGRKVVERVHGDRRSCREGTLHLRSETAQGGERE